MRIVIIGMLALLFVGEGYAQLGNATRLQGRPLSPEVPADTNTICWDAITTRWKPCVGGITAQTQLSTLPTFETDTCNTTIAINTLVQASGAFIVPATGTIGILGVARAACVGTGTTTIAKLGSQNCIAEGAVSANRLIIPGTIDPTKCKDSGTADLSSIPNTTPVIGVSRAAGTNGNAFEVTLIGPYMFGLQSGSGTLPEVESITSGVTTSVVVDLNTTLTSASQAYPVCATSARVGFEPGGWSFNAGLTQMTITFSPSAPATGSCTANLTGGSGGGGSSGGDFSSNTSTSVDGELVLFSGTGGKTGKRANVTGLPVLAAGVLSGSAATSSTVRGLWSGTCDDTTYLRGDGACETPAGGGGGTYSAGTGIAIAGTVISIDSATGRVFLGGTASLSFGTVATNACGTGTIPVTGAVLGDVALIAPGFDFTYSMSFSGYVSSADTVTVKVCNPTGSGIAMTAAQTYNATVLKTF